VQAYMSPIVQTADPEEDSWAVAQRTLDLGIQHMPVISDGTLVNLVSVRQLFSVDTRLPNAAKTLPQRVATPRSARPRPATACRQVRAPLARRRMPRSARHRRDR
jgi:hypothetical protein